MLYVNPNKYYLLGFDEVACEKYLERRFRTFDHSENMTKKVIHTKSAPEPIGPYSRSVPARSTVEVARLPKDVLVEIDCIASKLI